MDKNGKGLNLGKKMKQGCFHRETVDNQKNNLLVTNFE